MKKWIMTVLLLGLFWCMAGCSGEAEQEEDDWNTEWEEPEMPMNAPEATGTQIPTPTSTPTPTPTNTPTPTPTPVPVVTKQFGLFDDGDYNFNSDLDADTLYYSLRGHGDIYKTDMNTGKTELAATNLGERHGAFCVANGKVYYLDQDEYLWSASLADGTKRKYDVIADYDIYIAGKNLYYVDVVNVSATVREWRLIQIKDFEADAPEANVIYTYHEYFSIARANDGGSFLITTSSKEIVFSYFPTSYLNIYEYIAFSAEGEQIQIPTYGGHPTYNIGGEKVGIGWIGTDKDEKYLYGYVYADGTTQKEDTLSRLYKSKGNQDIQAIAIVGDIVYYSCQDGIMAHSLVDGTDRSVFIDRTDRDGIHVVAGNYMYYQYGERIYRVKLDGTGWEPVS